MPPSAITSFGEINPISGSARALATQCASAAASQTVSGFKNNTHSPEVRAQPRLFARPKPRFSPGTT